MWRRTRIKAVANIPARRTKDGLVDSFESAPGDTLEEHESFHNVKSEISDVTEMCGVSVTASCTNVNVSTPLSSEENIEILYETNHSCGTGHIGVIRSPTDLKERDLVYEVESVEYDDESSSQSTSLKDISSDSQQTKSNVDLSTETDNLFLLASQTNYTETAVGSHLEQTVLTEQDTSSNSSLTVGGLNKQNKRSLNPASTLPISRFARCIPKLPSYKAKSKKMKGSSVEPEDRHRIPKPTVSQLSLKLDDRSLKQHKISSNMDSVEKDVIIKCTQVKKVRRKIRSSVCYRLSKAKKEFQSKYKDARPDRSRLTMFDLLYYNPVTNPMRQTGQQETLVQSEDNESVMLRLQEEEVDGDVENETEDTSLPVPQVRLGADGQLIIDETSLVIETTATIKSKQLLANSSVVMEAGDGPSSYLAYHKKARPRSCSSWTKIETLRFYIGLKTFGTDFLLMKSIFPQFSRQELKLKYKKEERINRNLVYEALRHQNFDTEQMDKDLRKLEERERNLELPQLKDTPRKKEIAQLKKNTRKRFRAKRNNKGYENGKSSEGRQYTEIIDDSSDEAEVEEISHLNERISSNVKGMNNTENSTNATATESLTCHSYNANSCESSEETSGIVKKKYKDLEVKRKTNVKVSRTHSKSRDSYKLKKYRKTVSRTSAKKRNVKSKCSTSKKEERKVEGITSAEDEVSETEEMSSAEEGTGRLYIALSDTSEISRDNMDIDEDDCKIINTLEENAEERNLQSERQHTEMQYSVNEPQMMEHELRRLVGNAGGASPSGSSQVPLSGEVTTPAPGSLFILSSLSPTNPYHHIYKVFMVAPSEQLPSTSRSPH